MTPEPRTTEVKPTNAEMRRRIDITESLLIDGATVTDIKRYFSEKEGLLLARRTVERYRTFADRRIIRAAEPVREQERRKARLRLERCFGRSMAGKKPNVFAAIAAQRELNRLLGLNAPKDGEEEMSPERLADLVVQQQKEMKRLMEGPLGVKDEILDLLQLYKAFNMDNEELLQIIEKAMRSSNPVQPNSQSFD